MKYYLRPNFVRIKQEKIRTKGLKNFRKIFGELFVRYLHTSCESYSTIQVTQCMIKIFLRGGRSGDTFKTSSPWEQLLPLPTLCFKMFLERSLNAPHYPTSSIYHRLPPPHPPPLPKNLDHTNTSGKIIFQNMLRFNGY